MAAQEAEEEEEGFGMVRAGGRFIPLPSLEEEEVEFCLEMLTGLVEAERKGDGDGGVEGVGGEFEGKPKSFLALEITE